MSLPSTACVEPSTRRTLTSTIGLPVTAPCSMVWRTPFSTEGGNCCGIEPPKILSSHSKPPPRGSGSISIVASPYSPAPPDCFLYLCATRAVPVMVSRYGILGGCSSASTPNLRFIRSSATSRCTSPSPCTRTSLVTGSRSVEKVTSSSVRRAGALLIFSSSPFVLATTAADAVDVGDGNGGSVTGASLTQRVSPVCVWASLVTTPISPATTSGTVTIALPLG